MDRLDPTRDHDATQSVLSSYISNSFKNTKKQNNGKFSAMSTIAINKFDTSNKDEFSNNPAILFIGKRGSGKSLAIADIATSLKLHGMAQDCVVISPSDKYLPFYENKLGVKNVLYECSEGVIESILRVQSDRVKESIKNNTKCPNLLLILDDCVNVNGLIKSKPISELLFNGRHYKISFILAIQFPIGMPPELRCNFDQIFLGSDDMLSNQKRLYDHYAGVFSTFDSFRQVFNETCNGFSFLVISNIGKHKTFNSKVKHFSANINSACVIQDFEMKQILLDKQIKQTEQTEQTEQNTKYDLLKNILNCNAKICELVKNDCDNKRRIDILTTILKCNILIVDSFNIPNNVPNIFESINGSDIDTVFLCNSVDSVNNDKYI